MRAAYALTLVRPEHASDTRTSGLGVPVMKCLERLHPPICLEPLSIPSPSNAAKIVCKALRMAVERSVPFTFTDAIFTRVKDFVTVYEL